MAWSTSEQFSEGHWVVAAKCHRDSFSHACQHNTQAARSQAKAPGAKRQGECGAPGPSPEATTAGASRNEGLCTALSSSDSLSGHGRCESIPIERSGRRKTSVARPCAGHVSALQQQIDDGVLRPAGAFQRDRFPDPSDAWKRETPAHPPQSRRRHMPPFWFQHCRHPEKAAQRKHAASLRYRMPKQGSGCN